MLVVRVQFSHHGDGGPCHASCVYSGNVLFSMDLMTVYYHLHSLGIEGAKEYIDVNFSIIFYSVFKLKIHSSGVLVLN